MSPGRATVLFVCTANQARSPLAEAIAVDLFRRQGILLDVSSAGFLVGGWPAADDGRSVARERGLDLEHHSSRQLTAGIVDRADLIVAMTGEHVLDLGADWPTAVDRAFTLRELAATGAEAPPDATTPDAVRRWAAERAAAPRTAMMRGDLDVADPMGAGRRAFRRVAAQIADELDRAFCGWPTGDVSSAS